MRPRLLMSTLTGQVYVVTRYAERDGILTAHTKYDVTEDFLRAVAQHEDRLEDVADLDTEPS